jgi:Periplasmic copper-binding protein (NosD)
VLQGNREGLRVRVHLGLATIACALVALAALPGFAAAAEYSEFSVNSLLDTVEPTACETSSTSDECTLRSAIDLANSIPNVGSSIDRITFSSAVFGGAAPASRISIGSPLPAITESVEVFGGETPGRQCPTGWGLEGPCVELLAAGGTGILTVDASSVVVEGIAFDGAENGILVNEDGTQFTATNDWFGVGLNRGLGAGLSKAGIRLEPGADGAAIGGPDPAERNVFTTGDIGLYVDGASSSTTEGSYFGLRPDGEFPFGHTLDVGVRIVDDTRGTPVVKAVGNEVGGVLSAPEATSADCDGPCNVFAIEEEGADIDLAGFTGEDVAAASGPTRIRSNYLGLSPDGTEVIGRAEEAIYAGPAGGPTESGPSEVVVGGNNPLFERNFFVGGEYGVFAERAETLGVIGNEFGYLFDGSNSDSPDVAGIHVSSEGLAAGAFIAENRMNARTSLGIESLFKGSEISGNEIFGGAPGISTGEDSEGVGNLISGNRLVESERWGIRLVNDDNRVVGNTVVDASQTGITTFEPAEHNRIGGDEPGEANVIEKTGESSAEGVGAIVINGLESSVNEVAANEGGQNEGPFIDLQRENTGEGKPNHGILPPTFATAAQSSASGTAQPNAVVRLFNKASADEGELGGLLKAVEADAAGNWTATYAKQSVGGLVAATQTSPEGGTSRVSGPQAATVDPVPPPEPEPEKESGGGGTGGGTSGGGSTSPSPTPTPIAAPAPVAPKVKITAGPKKSSKSTTAKFKFTATPAAGAKFECKLDAAKWAKCRSPKTYKKLKPGKHTFQVRATADGLTGRVAKYVFAVKA